MSSNRRTRAVQSGWLALAGVSFALSYAQPLTDWANRSLRWSANHSLRGGDPSRADLDSP